MLRNIVFAVLLLLVPVSAYAQSVRPEQYKASPQCQCAPCLCGPACDCHETCLFNRNRTDPAMMALLQQIATNQTQILAILNKQQQPAPAAPQIVFLPAQQLPIAGAPLQQLPIAGAPQQTLPIAGAPLQQLPNAGQPLQQLPSAGQPLQVLPGAGKGPGGAPAQILPPAGVSEERMPNASPATGFQRITKGINYVR